MAGGREGGWLKIHRQLRSSELFRSLSAEQRSVFLSLLLLANWQERRALLAGGWITVRRGELAHSLAAIAAEAAVSVKVVRTTIAKLMLDDRPAGGRGPFLGERWTGSAPGTGLRVLSVLRYEEFQAREDDAGTASGTAGARQGHASGTAGAPREEGEEVKEGEEQATGAPPARPVARQAKQPTDPRLKPLEVQLVALFAELRGGERYLHGGAKDAQALKRLLSIAEPAEIARRWRLALVADGFHRCSSFAELAMPAKWSHFQALARPSPRAAPPSAAPDLSWIEALPAALRAKAIEAWRAKRAEVEIDFRPGDARQRALASSAEMLRAEFAPRGAA